MDINMAGFASATSMYSEGQALGYSGCSFRTVIVQAIHGVVK